MGSLVSCATRSDEVDRQADCERMREHVIDLRVAGFDRVRTSDGKKVDLAGHRDALRDALDSHFVGNCVARMSDTELMCRKNATDITALRSCATH